MSLRRGKGSLLFPTFVKPEGKPDHSHLDFSTLPAYLVLGLA